MCLSLLLFNGAYVLSLSSRKKSREKNKALMYKIILEEYENIKLNNKASAKHVKFILQKLKKIKNLLAYYEASVLLMHQKEDIARYFDIYTKYFSNLALFYENRQVMEKAFFAYFLASFHDHIHEKNRISEIMLRYLDNSNIYVRENVLLCLYSLGNAEAIIQALTILNDNGWYHDKRLLSDGLLQFNGDKIILINQLWEKMFLWDENFQIAIIQAAQRISGNFVEQFYNKMIDDDISVETKFAFIRYFQTWYYPEAGEYLRSLLSEENRDKGGLSIVAASALINYPDEKTHEVLLNAVLSKNFFVRYNAAKTLVHMGFDENDKLSIINTKDKYAIEVIKYMTEYKEEIEDIARIKGVTA